MQPFLRALLITISLEGSQKRQATASGFGRVGGILVMDSQNTLQNPFVLWGALISQQNNTARAVGKHVSPARRFITLDQQPTESFLSQFGIFQNGLRNSLFFEEQHSGPQGWKW